MSCKSLLANDWVNYLIETISMNLGKVSKGWYNLHESNTETYEFSKLKKLLTILKYMMQESILNLAQRSVKIYTNTLKKYVPNKVTIKSINNIYIDAPADYDKDYSLIVIDIVSRYEEVPDPKNPLKPKIL